MFTGLIQSKGKVIGINTKGIEARLAIEPLIPFSNYVIGESIAVNGVCLTVETFDNRSFTAFASAETLSRSNLGKLQKGSMVNLERALKLGDSIGGHMVSGHIDNTCTVESIKKSSSSLVYRFKCSAGQSRYIVAKGSVAVDGISLTVNSCGNDFFEVNIIPATCEATTMGEWQAGRTINIETDIIGKYVEKLLGGWNSTSETKSPAHSLSLDFFKNNGF